MFDVFPQGEKKMTMTNATTTLKATGNAHILGAVKLDDFVTKHFTPEMRACPETLSGKVVSDYLYIGGSYSSSKETLVNYKAGDGCWSKVVKLSKGTKFTLKVLSRGSAMNMARIEVIIYEEDYSFQELNCLQEVKTLLEEYPKDMILEAIYKI